MGADARPLLRRRLPSNSQHAMSNTSTTSMHSSLIPPVLLPPNRSRPPRDYSIYNSSSSLGGFGYSHPWAFDAERGAPTGLQDSAKTALVAYILRGVVYIPLWRPVGPRLGKFRGPLRDSRRALLSPPPRPRWGPTGLQEGPRKAPVTYITRGVCYISSLSPLGPLSSHFRGSLRDSPGALPGFPEVPIGPQRGSKNIPGRPEWHM